MKKYFVMVVLSMFVAQAIPAFAEKGASEKAQEHASDQAIFNRIGDWFSTIGKSDEEKVRIKAERKAKRASKRAEKEARKQAKKAGKKMEDGKVEGKKKAKKMKNKMKGSKKGS